MGHGDTPRDDYDEWDESHLEGQNVISLSEAEMEPFDLIEITTESGSTHQIAIHSLNPDKPEGSKVNGQIISTTRDEWRDRAGYVGNLVVGQQGHFCRVETTPIKTIVHRKVKQSYV